MINPRKGQFNFAPRRLQQDGIATGGTKSPEPGAGAEHSDSVFRSIAASGPGAMVRRLQSSASVRKVSVDLSAESEQQDVYQDEPSVAFAGPPHTAAHAPLTRMQTAPINFLRRGSTAIPVRFIQKTRAVYLLSCVCLLRFSREQGSRQQQRTASPTPQLERSGSRGSHGSPPPGAALPPPSLAARPEVWCYCTVSIRVVQCN